MKRKKWTNDECNIVINNYSNEERKTILNLLPNRTWEAIIQKAIQLNIRRVYSKTRIGDLSILLNDSPISYYWIGFILADGTILNNKRLRITLANKDEKHLLKFAELINGKINPYRGSFVSLAISHSEVIKKLSNKFDIKSNKTYHPPNINIFKNISEELLFSLMIGFIDGDGCIRYVHNRTDAALSVKCHSSWINILKLLFGNSRINNSGYAFSSITDNTKIREFKRKAIDLNLPIMKRKWDKIDENRISKYVISKLNREQIKEMLKLNYKQKEIAKILNVSNSGISSAIKRYKLKDG